MTFALVGAHRTGKSTLARRLSEDMGLHYHDASFGRIAKELGFAAVAPQDVAQRVVMQEQVLKRYEEELGDVARPFITDRTPLDMIGYMLGEVSMHNGLAPELQDRIAVYAEHCIDATERHFDSLIVLRPLPVYTVEEGKPPPDRAYQQAVQMIIEGGAMQVMHKMPVFVIRSSVMERRVEQAAAFVANRCDHMNVARARANLQ